MKQIYKFSTALALSALCFTGADAAPKSAPVTPEINISAVMRSMAPNANLIQNKRTAAINKANQLIAGKVDPRFAGFEPDETIEPSFSVGPVGDFRDMDGPNGDIWYYTTHLTSKAIKHEYFTEYVLSEYRFEIYDSQMQHQGTIQDKMRYRDDEVRVPGPALGIDLLPMVTKHYFNTDDKYEFVVSLAVNTTTPGHNHYRSVVYSLGGEKETLPVYDPATGAEVDKVCDKPAMEIDAFINDVLDASTDGEENYYITFSGVINQMAQEGDDDYDYSLTGNAYWEQVKRQTMVSTVYSKVNDKGELQLVKTFRIPYIQMQGNQESSPVIISMLKNGKPYVVVPYYKDTFYNPYYSMEDDLSMRENNSLVIDLYELHPTEAVLANHTEIPMMKDEEHNALFTYYSVGSLRWSQDIDFGHFSTDGKPSYYITRSNYKIATDSESDFCYYVYDVNGSQRVTIFEYAQSNLALSDIDGVEPQHCFVDYDEQYIYYLVNLYTGLTRKTVYIESMLKTDPDSDADLLMANFDRVAVGPNDWNYCFELRVPTVDEDENDVMRFAWFDKQGKYLRMDYVNMGKGVFYAQSLMNAVALDKKLFNADDAQEYMLLVKRGIEDESTASQEELVVAQPQSEDNDWKGKTLLYLVPCEKGTLRGINISPVLGGENKLMVTWYKEINGADNFTAEFYDLPFVTSADIVDTVADDACPIAFDGHAVSCPGLDIAVYNLQGIAVAHGYERVDTAALPAGIYLAVSAGNSLKFIVK